MSSDETVHDFGGGRHVFYPELPDSENREVLLEFESKPVGDDKIQFSVSRTDYSRGQEFREIKGIVTTSQLLEILNRCG